MCLVFKGKVHKIVLTLQMTHTIINVIYNILKLNLRKLQHEKFRIIHLTEHFVYSSLKIPYRHDLILGIIRLIYSQLTYVI